ncbi:MAG: hypothetical protein P8J87_19445, partial [Verrucomicrobiales bacterium]|nr:hypothetical protein [Verrucomicrobiales bacterium]
MKTFLALALAAAPLFSLAQEEETNRTLNDLEHAIEAVAEAKDVEKLPGLIDQAAAIDLRAALSYAAQYEIDGAIIGGKWRPTAAGLPDAFTVA